MVFYGLLSLILIYGTCFALICTIKLTLLGVATLKKPKEQPLPQKEIQPVYYIVEKKRAKKRYSEPKEIKFN